jgi:hypothetical protein
MTTLRIDLGYATAENLKQLKTSGRPGWTVTFNQVKETLMSNAKLCQFLILTVTAGCTTQTSKDQGAHPATAAAPDVQCHSEQITGSLMSRSLCTTKAERDAQQANNEDIQQQIRSQSNRSRPIGGSTD